MSRFNPNSRSVKVKFSKKLFEVMLVGGRPNVIKLFLEFLITDQNKSLK